MKMLENIMVLIIFFFLLVLGFVFYGLYHQQSVAKTSKHFSDLELIELAQKVPYLPEIQCPSYLELDNCVDLMKVKAFASLAKQPANKIYYAQYLGLSNLTLKLIYPFNYTINFYSLRQNRTSGRLIEVPISVYDPQTKNVAFGMLDLVMYE